VLKELGPALDQVKVTVGRRVEGAGIEGFYAHRCCSQEILAADPVPRVAFPAPLVVGLAGFGERGLNVARGVAKHFEWCMPVCLAYLAAPAANDQGNGRKDLPGHRSFIPYVH
jgi:hypothetical protein